MGLTDCDDNGYGNICSGYARIFQFKSNLDKFIVLPKGKPSLMTTSKGSTLSMDLSSADNIRCEKNQRNEIISTANDDVMCEIWAK